MSIFVDTGVWYAHHDRDASRHPSAKTAFNTILSGAYGHPFTSDHILGEAVTLTRARTDDYDATRRIADRIRGVGTYPDATELLILSEEQLIDVLAVLDRYRDHPLSFTDASTITLMNHHGIESLLSFDSDFDGIVNRIDPRSI